MSATMINASLKLSASRRNAPARHGAGCPCCTGRKQLSCQRGANLVAKAAGTSDKTAKASATKASGAEVKDQFQYMAKRMSDVSTHFPTALNASDFLTRVEIALNAHGFRGDNSISCTNLCRDESTGIFKTMIDNIWGNSFNINGLGACLTCGCLGFKAGFSHSPICSQGKERYVFFSFPHIAIGSDGKVGAISRPGRAGPSSACGALIAALGQFQADAKVMDAFAEGAHDPADPEFAILKQRLAARIKTEGLDVKDMDLVDMTQLAERAISADLEHLISQTVDPSKANYAVVTGVHIHNWGNEASGEPTLEWIAPSSMYVVNDGKRVNINLQAVPALSPRQLGLLQSGSAAHDLAAAFTGTTTVVETKFKDPAAGPKRA